MRQCIVFVVCLVFASTALAEARWEKIDKADELTDEKQDMVVVFSDEENERLQKAFCIGFKDGEPEYIGVAVSQVERIAPDRFGTNEVSVTYRAKDAPVRTGKWKLFPNNMEIHLQPPTKEAAIEMVSGDSLLIQIDRSGKRYKFDLSGPKGDELREYVRKKLAAP